MRIAVSQDPLSALGWHRLAHGGDPAVDWQD